MSELDFNVMEMARAAGVRLPSNAGEMGPDELLRLADFCDQHVANLLDSPSILLLMRDKARRMDEILWFHNAAKALRGAADALSEGTVFASDDPIHEWFELTYAQYLTVPRTALQSMPTKWQREFVRLLEEMDAAIDWRPKRGRYRVQLFEIEEVFDEDEQLHDHVFQWGRELEDPLQDYERGRRKLPL